MNSRGLMPAPLWRRALLFNKFYRNAHMVRNSWRAAPENSGSDKIAAIHENAKGVFDP